MLSRLRWRAAPVSAAITFLLSTVCPASAQPAWSGAVSTIATDLLNEIDLAGDAAGNAIAIWRTQSSEIRVAHFSAVAKTWAAPITLQGPSSYSADIAMTPTGDAVALWSDLSADQSRIRSARYSSASATWSAPVTLATTPSGAGGLQVAVDADGNAAAIWEALGGSYDSHLRAARYSAANGVWSAAADITSLAYNGSLAAQPRIVLDAFGSATAIFWTGNPPTRALAASRSGPGSTSWSSPQALRAGAGSTPGSIAADAAGNVFAVWPSPVTGGSGDRCGPLRGRQWDVEPCANPLLDGKRTAGRGGRCRDRDRGVAGTSIGEREDAHIEHVFGLE